MLSSPFSSTFFPAFNSNSNTGPGQVLGINVQLRSLSSALSIISFPPAHSTPEHALGWHHYRFLLLSLNKWTAFPSAEERMKPCWSADHSWMCIWEFSVLAFVVCLIWSVFTDDAYVFQPSQIEFWHLMVEITWPKQAFYKYPLWSMPMGEEPVSTWPSLISLSPLATEALVTIIYCSSVVVPYFSSSFSRYKSSRGVGRKIRSKGWSQMAVRLEKCWGKPLMLDSPL